MADVRLAMTTEHGQFMTSTSASYEFYSRNSNFSLDVNRTSDTMSRLVLEVSGTKNNQTNVSNAIQDLASVDDTGWKRIDDIAFNIETYYLWVILALGFPSNCCTIVTIIKMSPAKSLTVYIALLAIVDNLAIVVKLLLFVLTDYGVQIGPFGCKFLGFLGNSLITLANWILVAISAERFVAIRCPLKIGHMWTFRKSIIVVLAMIVLFAGLFLHLFWSMDYFYDGHTAYVYCVIKKKYMHFMINVWYWINIAVYGFVPCTLLIVFNTLIIHGIVRNGKNQLLTRNGSFTSGLVNAPRQRQITFMLVVSAIALVILTIPRCIMLILAPYQQAPNNTMRGATMYLVDTIAYVLCDSTHAINFYVYSLSARRFRKQFIDLVLCRKRKLTPGTHHFTLSSRMSTRSSVSSFRGSLKKPFVKRSTSAGL